MGRIVGDKVRLPSELELISRAGLLHLRRSEELVTAAFTLAKYPFNELFEYGGPAGVPRSFCLLGQFTV